MKKDKKIIQRTITDSFFLIFTIWEAVQGQTEKKRKKKEQCYKTELQHPKELRRRVDKNSVLHLLAVRTLVLIIYAPKSQTTGEKKNINYKRFIKLIR